MTGYPGHLTAPADEQDGGLKPLPPQLMVVMNIINTLTHFFLGAVSIGAIMFATQFSLSNSFQTHVIMNVIGYIILMSQAVLCMNPHTGWAQSLKYQDKKTIHWVMQILGSLLAIIGSVVRIADVRLTDVTGHAICGIIALAFTILSLIGGVVNLYSVKLKQNSKITKIGHAFFGSLTLFFAFITLILGFDKWFVRLLFGQANANLLIAFTVFALLGTVMSACIGVIRRIINK